MEACRFSDIESDVDAMVAAIATEQGIDPICSTSNWVVPLAAAFAPRSIERVFTGRNGLVALLEHPTPDGPVLSGMDTVWGFATPLLGPDPAALVTDFAAILSSLDYAAVSISGISGRGSLFPMIERLGPAGYTDTADRCVADLSEGFEAWISRRSARFRRSLRVAAHRGDERGVTIEHLAPSSADIDEVLARILSVEKTSWKTDDKSGLIDTKLGVFTLAMCTRFAHVGALRVQFAQLEGTDIGYVLGARVGNRYRGFQHSFNQNYPDLSIGKMLQFHTIAAMSNEGVASYDMGMHMTYKESYADRVESTITAILTP